MKDLFQKITNALGSISAILAVVSGIMAEVLNCKGEDIITATCSASWLDPKYAAIAAAIFGGIALFSKAMRPGGLLRSIFGSTAVVVPEDSKHSVAGTVTPAQVAAP